LTEDFGNSATPKMKGIRKPASLINRAAFRFAAPSQIEVQQRGFDLERGSDEMSERGLFCKKVVANDMQSATACKAERK